MSVFSLRSAERDVGVVGGVLHGVTMAVHHLYTYYVTHTCNVHTNGAYTHNDSHNQQLHNAKTTSTTTSTTTTVMKEEEVGSHCLFRLECDIRNRFGDILVDRFIFLFR